MLHLSQLRLLSFLNLSIKCQFLFSLFVIFVTIAVIVQEANCAPQRPEKKKRDLEIGCVKRLGFNRLRQLKRYKCFSC